MTPPTTHTAPSRKTPIPAPYTPKPWCIKLTGRWQQQHMSLTNGWQAQQHILVGQRQLGNSLPQTIQPALGVGGEGQPQTEAAERSSLGSSDW
jgi:hypothetical protein